MQPCEIRRRTGYRRLAMVALPAVISLCTEAEAERADPYEQVSVSWDRFGAVYSRVLEHYYSPVDHEQIMRAAIDGLLRQLDPYSQYYDEEGLRQLRQDTTGKFAGLGITVGIKDHYPVVIAPIEGTPADRAGLLPGDLIVSVEGHDTYGQTLEDVVSELRGEPGTTVRITLSRKGVSTHWDVAIVREVIKIGSVAVADEILPGIGYISMKQTRFSEETSSEMESALQQVLAREVEGLILDLRGNPGGLLSQATEVADLFLPKGAPIVAVRERDGNREETKYSERPPSAGSIPLIVLIDGGSASAAEIVAGAIQDNDRGLVVGTTSFGKGSVQTIFDLGEHDKAALKLTTALYYTPSGRTIHRESLAQSPGLLLPVPIGEVGIPAGLLLSVLLRSQDANAAIDQLRARFDLDESAARQVLETELGDLVGHGQGEADTSAHSGDLGHRTTRGRPVYGGGGIAPDVVVEPERPPPYVQELQRHRVFFDFIVEYVGAGLTTGDTSALSDYVDDDMLAAFRKFIPRSAMAEARHRQSSEALHRLRQLADESGWSGHIMASIDSLEAAIRRRGEEVAFPPEVERHVRAGLRRELALRLDGSRASLLVNLETDPQVMEAVRLLRDRERYAVLLGGK